MQAVLVQNLREKYALKYATYMRHNGNMWRK